MEKNRDSPYLCMERNSPMAVAYIVDAVRTAGGRRGGRLAGVHPVDLGAAVFDAIADRNDFDTKAIDDVITGCVSQGGQQTMDLGRNAVPASRLPHSLPAVPLHPQAGTPDTRRGGD